MGRAVGAGAEFEQEGTEKTEGHFHLRSLRFVLENPSGYRASALAAASWKAWRTGLASLLGKLER